MGYVGYLSFVSWHVKVNTFFAFWPDQARYSIKPTKLLIAWQKKRDTMVEAGSDPKNIQTPKKCHIFCRANISVLCRIFQYSQKIVPFENSWSNCWGWLNPQSWELRDKPDDGPFFWMCKISSSNQSLKINYQINPQSWGWWWWWWWWWSVLWKSK